MPKVTHPLLHSLGATIRSLRVDRRLSQEALADMANIDRSYMSSIERGLRNVSVLNMARIASALGVPLADLIDGRRPLPFPSDAQLDETVLETWEPGGYLSMG